MDSARGLLKSKEFFQIITDGLNNEKPFVRYHYIQFTQKLVPLMQKVISPNELSEHVKSLIDCFCDLLQRADISAYETQTRAGINLLNYREADQEEPNEQDHQKQ